MVCNKSLEIGEFLYLLHGFPFKSQWSRGGPKELFCWLSLCCCSWNTDTQSNKRASHSIQLGEPPPLTSDQGDWESDQGHLLGTEIDSIESLSILVPSKVAPVLTLCHQLGMQGHRDGGSVGEDIGRQTVPLEGSHLLTEGVSWFPYKWQLFLIPINGNIKNTDPPTTL